MDVLHLPTDNIVGIQGSLPDRSNREKFFSEASRACFITRQDARNIVRTLDNAMKHRHENDALSVERLVRELQQEEKNVVISYKPQERRMKPFPNLAREASCWLS